MPLGPGKYDDLCTYVREQANAGAAIVIVLGGRRGEGFSVQVAGPRAADLTERLPGILEELATQIRVTIARDVAEEEAADAYEALSEEIQELREEVAGLRREIGALKRGVVEELVRLREALA